MLKFATLGLALCLPALAVEIRVVTYNIGAQFSEEGYPEYSLGHAGTDDHDKVRDVLARIGADVVALQEIASADLSNPDDLADLRASLGYPYFYITPTASASNGQPGPFDTSLRISFLSKYPLISSDSVRSPVGARELTRLHPVVRVDIPGTDRDPYLISAHLKSGTTQADRYRRAVEMKRLAGHLTTLGLTDDDNFIILGDFNLSSSNSTFTTAPGGLPGTYTLGSDITYPIVYSTNPLSYFSSPLPVRLDPRQLNGSNRTYGTSGSGGSTIDLMLISPALAGRPYSTEIYNSALDTSNSVGLPKTGSPPAANTSALASDHYAVFADLELDQDFPNLDLTVTPSNIQENSPSGTSVLRIAIPATRATDLTVNLSSDTPEIARPVSPTAVIPAGSLFTTVPVQTFRNFVTDEGNSVGFSVTATNYDPDSAVLQVLDSEASYTFTSLNQTITETFSGFDGTHDPAPWITTGTLPWNGIESGTSPVPGFRSYGPGSDPSLGFLPNSGTPAPVTFSATYRNLSPQTLDAIAISMTAAQWRAATGGTNDRLTASVITSSSTRSVPALTFLPSTNLPGGPLSPPAEILLTSTVDGLSVPPGQSFDLRFTLTPGTGGGTLSKDIFVNEFHYDNSEVDDTGEFVEIAVAPGFAGNLADVNIILYNGQTAEAAAPYGTHSLDTFTLGSVTASGHRLFHKYIPDIQNGPRDGFAVVHGTDVLHFISYEGTMTATSGPAAGMTSVATTVSQTTPQPPGVHSVRLIGTGSSASDFTWAKNPIPHSPGFINEGQTFTSPSQAQGISLDDISVTFLPPDIDTDGDGFTDRIEQNLLLTNPTSATSRFFATMTPVDASTSRLSFPTLQGRKYLVQSSENLTTWQDGPTYSGNGAPRNVDYTVTPGMPKRFYRIVVTFE